MDDLEVTFDRKLSHTSLSTFRRCQMRYKWSYVDDYEPLSSKGQIMGGTGHAGAGAWYQHLHENPEDYEHAENLALKAASGKLAEYEEAAGYEMEDIWNDISIILPRYFAWSIENDDFTAHDIEYRFDLKVGPFTVIGYFDGIVETKDGSWWLLEHKFTKQVRTKHIEIDPQVSLYLLAARALKYNLRGVLYNVIRTTIRGKAENDPVVRLPVYRNNEGLAYIVRELVSQMSEMQKFHAVDGVTAYRNETMDCSWDCGFFNACLAINDDGDPKPVLNTLPRKRLSLEETLRNNLERKSL